MNQTEGKPLLTSREGLINKAQRRPIEQRPPKPQAGVQFPPGPPRLRLRNLRGRSSPMRKWSACSWG